MTEFKPMLACAPKFGPDGNPIVSYPLYVQPKLDGIRASVVNGKLLTRTLKQVPNRAIYEALSDPAYEGLDGELIVGDPTADDCYRRTSSFVMSESKTGEPWCFFVFDKHDEPGGFAGRYPALGRFQMSLGATGGIQVVPTYTANDAAELAEFEQTLVDAGHEGAILRQPHAPYKYGRASKTKGELVKLKRFEDAEAEVIGVYEEMHNNNVAVRNALGRTERSTAQAGLIGKGTLGGFYLRDLETGIEFKCGTGFDAAERADLWLAAALNETGPNPSRNGLNGRIVKYKSFKIGVKEKPRHPVFLGFRDARDM